MSRNLRGSKDFRLLVGRIRVGRDSNFRAPLSPDNFIIIISTMGSYPSMSILDHNPTNQEVLPCN